MLELKKVLVVDDEDMIRNFMIIMLPDINQYITITEARDGLEALELLRSNSFDLVISDIRMPNMEGTELKRRAKEEGIKVEIILMSADAREELIIEIRKDGKFISKPFNFKDAKFTILESLGLFCQFLPQQGNDVVAYA